VNVKELVDQFSLNVVAGQKGLDHQIQGGYCGDLLSDVMGNAPIGCIWLTVQTHQNIVAVAVLRDQEPDQETVEKADEEGIPILLWEDTAFDLAGQVFQAGVVNA
jgi:serine kinase of HPr protein (carbohydrate metabolism regulator)